MKFVFRVDASEIIGTGHVVRCATFAHTLAEAGHEVYFICREHLGHLGEWLKQKGFKVFFLPKDTDTDLFAYVDDEYLAWLGTTQDKDAAQTKEILAQIKPDWLIVDHYGIDHLWEKQLRADTRKIMVIDDLANRLHDADLLLDQNLFLNYETRYQHLVSESCQQLLGPKYALLRPEFAYYRSIPKTQNKQPKILVFFGGVDLIGETLKFLQAIQGQFTQYKFEVVLGTQSPHFQAALSLSEKQEHITLWFGCDEMAKLMHQCDFAFGASGSTNWERFCLGLNAALVCVADNQRQLLNELESQNLVVQLTKSDDQIQSYRLFLSQLEFADEKLNQRRVKIQSLVDGNGIIHAINEINKLNTFN